MPTEYAFRSNRNALPPWRSDRHTQPQADPQQAGLLGLGYPWPCFIPAAGYLFIAAGGVALPAQPSIPGSPAPTLRSGDVKIPFSIDFSPDMTNADAITSATATVLAQDMNAPTATQSDVTSTILQGSPIIAGTAVKLLLGNANAVRDTAYTLRIIVTLATGEKIQESITGIICDE